MKIRGALITALAASLAVPAHADNKLSAKEKSVLGEVEKDVSRVQAIARRHDERIREILFREYERRRATLERRYDSELGKAEKLQGDRRLNAIAILQKFVNDHPHHAQFTPDAMFRLADLYLDQSNEEFETRFDQQNDGSANLDEDEELIADYSRSLDLWNQVVTRFPEYRQRASAMYLLAYYLKQTGEERKALAVARGLVCRDQFDPAAAAPAAPTRDQVKRQIASKKKRVSDVYTRCLAATRDETVIEDAWVRIVGDIHFLTAGELPEAIAAYQRVARDKESKFYDEALYKLAWSYYRNDDFLEGIKAFDESIVLSDKLVADGKDPLELRPEALAYIAISFTDPWTAEEQPDPVRAYDRAMDFYKSRLGEPHVRDVFVQLGETFEILEAWDQAIDSWKVALKNFPLHPENPKVHQKIIVAYQTKGERELADDEAAKMAQLYAVGSDWYKANETNREAIETVADMGERLLKTAALNMHRSAQESRKEYLAAPSEEKKAAYIALYQKAAILYQKFLQENPTADEIYEYTYFLGDTYFWSEQYASAIEHYRWVRDHRDLSSEKFDKASLSLVQSYEKEVERQVASGQVKSPPEPTLADLKAMKKPIAKQPIPTIYKSWQTALDEYQKTVKDPASAPTMGYLAGLISYRFLDLDDAAKRFEVTFETFCGNPNAVKAKDGLLSIYEATGQSKKFEETNQRFITKKCGTDDDIKIAKTQNRSKKFREAEDMTSASDFGTAALSFFRYYKDSPDDDPNKPTALYNAALNYDKAGRPKTAVYLYKEFTDNPSPAFKTSDYYLTSLYLTAVAYNNAFDYDNAVKTYLNVVNVAKEPNRKAPAGLNLSLAEIQTTSLYNAAVLRELDRVYEGPTGAVALYKRYAAQTTVPAERDKALWAVARIYKNSNQLANLATAYAEWRKASGKDSGNEDKYVFSFHALAKEYEKRGQAKPAQKMKEETIRAWEAVGRPVGGSAADMAAEFSFEQAEAQKVAKFDPFKITKAPKTEPEAKKVLANLDEISNATRNRFNDLSRYESGTFGLAAVTRVGDVFFFQGLKIKEVPPPKQLEEMDAKYPDKNIMLQYQDAIDAVAQPLIDQAAKQWEKVVQAGRQKGVSNEWTRLAQERLHDFIDQSRYPVLRQELVEGTQTP